MRFMRHVILLIGIIILSLTFTGNIYKAEEAVVLKTGKAGKDIVWTMYDDGRLVFSGTGAMEDTDWSTNARWYSHIYTIENVIFEEGITYIGECAFNWHVHYCETIKSVTIPSTVTEIGEYAFLGMQNLEAVYITDLEQWCNIKFHNNGANPLETKADLYVNGEIVEHLVIPNSVTEISDKAFMGCTSLKTVEVHKNVTQIGSCAFNSCPNLKEMYFYGNAPVFGESVYILSNLTAYYPQNNKTWTDDVMRSADVIPGFEGKVTWVSHTLSDDTEAEKTGTEKPKTDIIETESEKPKTEIVETESEKPKTDIIETESEKPKTEIVETESKEQTTEIVEPESEEVKTEVVETETENLQSEMADTELRASQRDNENHLGKIVPVVVILLLVGVCVGFVINKKRIEK